MKIRRILAVPGWGSHFCDDIAALHASGVSAADRYTAPPVTEGFVHAREPGEALSLGAVLEDDSIVWGDAMGVSYAGKAGRDPVFRAKAGALRILEEVAPQLEGARLELGFRALQAELPALPVALSYGLSQMLLAAVSRYRRVTMTEIICREWELEIPREGFPVQGQCGSDRFDGADKLIVRKLDALPHSLVDDIATQVGARGEKLLDYARWLASRVAQLGGPEYQPVIHLDVHGALGKIFAGDTDTIVDYIALLEKTLSPLHFRIESAVIEETRSAQLQTFARLRSRLEHRGLTTELVVDEWANTLEDIEAFAVAGAGHMIHVKMPDLGGIEKSIAATLFCHSRKMKVLLGGSCNETDLSARAAVHVGLAVRPEAFLARPGLGVDEAVALTRNEAARALAEIRGRR